MYLVENEVLKLKNIGEQTVKLYREAGIFKPACLQEKTKERCYHHAQIPVLDVIESCLKAGVTLEELQRCIGKNGDWDLRRLQERIKVAGNTQRANVEVMKMLRRYEEKRQEIEVVKEEEGIYARGFKQRFYLIQPFSGNFNDMNQFENIIDFLYNQANKLKIEVVYNRGLLYYALPKGIKEFVFIETESTKVQCKNTYINPEGEYLCQMCTSEAFEEEKSKYLRKSYPVGTALICTEMFDMRGENTKSYVEMVLC